MGGRPRRTKLLIALFIVVVSLLAAGAADAKCYLTEIHASTLSICI